MTYTCLCLLLLSKKLLMDLTLACKRSLSAFLMICHAFSVLIVVFILILTGVIAFTDTSKCEYAVIPVVTVPYL